MHQIPFKLSRNKIILPVRVKGSRELEVILDTGMHFDGLLIYKKSLTAAIGLENPVEVQVGGAGSGSAPKALMSDSTSFFIGEVPFE